VFGDDSKGGVVEGEGVRGIKFPFLVDYGWREIVENVSRFGVDLLLVVELIAEC